MQVASISTCHSFEGKGRAPGLEVTREGKVGQVLVRCH